MTTSVTGTALDRDREPTLHGERHTRVALGNGTGCARDRLEQGMAETKSTKQQEARDLIPESLRSEFDKLVEDYRYHAMLRHGAPYVSYFVLADLIMFGWRRLENMIDDG